MRKDLDERKQEILDWINNNESLVEICKKLSCKRETLKSWFKRNKIEYAGNQGRKGIKREQERLPALELIKSPTISNSKKRTRLIEDGLKENKCEICGLSEWMGKPIPLELHHKDFNHWNNELENLQILCSNCHMQAHNYNNTKPPVV